jgi:hypothetical protein
MMMKKTRSIGLVLATAGFLATAAPVRGAGSFLNPSSPGAAAGGLSRILGAFDSLWGAFWTGAGDTVAVEKDDETTATCTPTPTKPCPEPPLSGSTSGGGIIPPPGGGCIDPNGCP